MKLRTFVTIAMMAAVAPVAAQEAGVQERVEAVKAQLDAHKMVLAEKIAIEGMQERMTIESRVTAGAPYSGEAVTESLQVLADGNRIAKKTVARVYRDSEGRTRRETIGTDGQVDNINISDPVAHVTYVLDPRNKTASRSEVVMVTPSDFPTAGVTAARSVFVAGTPADAAKVEEKEQHDTIEVRVRSVAGTREGGSGSGVTGGTVSVSGGGRGGLTAVYPAMTAGTLIVGKTTTEDLGQQIVEGVMATGSRSTTVIEAGAIGNEQPIRIVSEQWFATDLQLLIMTKHSDPRSGETSYRLTNLTQAEQARSLFEVGPDYAVKASTIHRRDPALKN